jgi:hypothetical protein
MELDRIKILVDKYFEGTTSLDEEQELTTLLTTYKDLTEEYKAVKMMLGSFAELSRDASKSEVKVNPEVKRRNIFYTNRKWLTGVAAAVAVLIGATVMLSTGNDVETISNTNPEYICYVNGVKVEDDQLAYAEASRLLGSISEDMQLAMAEVNRLTHYTIAK